MPNVSAPWRQCHFIDAHKGASPFFILALMYIFDAWHNATAWAYLATHGLYGGLWVLKSRTFPDKQFEKPCSLAYAMVIWGALSLYWISPYLIVTRDLIVPPWYLGLCLSVFGMGVFLHFAADMQKHAHLRLAPGTLLTDGLWAHCRNPNYLGELCIYLGFSALAMHWVPLAALASMVACVWIPNMLQKDRSLARYAAFGPWKQRSGLLFPAIPYLRRRIATA